MTNKGGIGFVIQANAPLDQSRLERLLKAADAPNTSHTVLNNPTYAAHLKANVAPQSHFYLRNYDNDGDENDWKRDPVEYFNQYEHQVLGKGLGLQIANEPGWGKDITDKLTRFMLEAERRNMPVSIGGFSVGVTPNSAAGWAEHDALVQTLCRRPDLFTLDAHEYGLGVPTSGMITAETKPGEVLYFTTALLRKDQWPTSITQLTNMYHIGRIKHFFDYVRSKGYKLPTVDIGECAFDFVSDQEAINNWGKSQPHTNPNPVIGHIRGYKSMGKFWPEKVDPPDPNAENEEDRKPRSIQQTHMDSLAWVRTVIYNPLGVRSMRVFTIGNSGGDTSAKPTNWIDFDWNTDHEMQDVFWRYQMAPTPPPPVEPPPEPKPEPPPVTKVVSKHVITVTGTDLHAVSSVDTVLRMFAQAMEDGLVIAGVDEIKVTNGE